ncbi:MAG: hypothetical protein V4772_03735 [Pseudomonadota bacterium]
MLNLKYALAICACALAATPALACYTVYNSANQVVYSGYEPPIDMTYQIHQRLPNAFPGGHMVFGNSTDCQITDSRLVVPQLASIAVSAATAATASAPPTVRK